MFRKKQKKNFVSIPGANFITLDPKTVSCIRIQEGEAGSCVVIHTSEGYGVVQVPTGHQEIIDLYFSIRELIG